MTTDISAELPAPTRLALAYAPGWARPAWTGLLVLDQRLARAALRSPEPVLGQLRLAWWRDRFRDPAAAWPQGEPLLALLVSWDRERDALARLVDGWERMIGGGPSADDQVECARSRAEAIVALARLLSINEAAIAPSARRWAATDLARRLGIEAAGEGAAREPQLPRAMRPLTLLLELAGGRERGLKAWARLVRLGLWGR